MIKVYKKTGNFAKKLKTYNLQLRTYNLQLVGEAHVR
jgi:hypothetical protein